MKRIINQIESCRRSLRLAWRYRVAQGGTIVLSDRDAGLFSIYLQVLGALDVARRVGCGIKLNFTTARYYDAKSGFSGWWGYYFETDRYFRNFEYSGGIAPEVPVSSQNEISKFAHLGKMFSRPYAHFLSGHLRLKAGLSEEIKQYLDTNFRGHPVIGVHYRGTDKVEGAYKEADRLSYEKVCQTVDKASAGGRIFVATDEQLFLDHMIGRYGSRVLYLDAERSGDGSPVHLGNNSTLPITGYLLGKEALLDACLLAKTNLLIRTKSNLSLVSAYMNPDLPVISI